MPIWTYSCSHTKRQFVETILGSPICIFCRSPLRSLPSESGYYPHPINPEVSFRITRRVRLCEVCSWWVKSERIVIYDFDYDTESRQSSAAAGILLELDVSDQSIPLSAIRSYLAAKYDSPSAIPLQKLEEVVGSAYKDFGYSIQVIGHAGDGGIAVILERSRGTRIGVQVRRYKNKAKVEQIRSLLGALVRNGYTSWSS